MRSLNWQIMSHSGSTCGVDGVGMLNVHSPSGLARMGHPLTTAYTTLGPEGAPSSHPPLPLSALTSFPPAGLQHSLAEPSVRLLFTNAPLLPTLLKVLPDCPSLRWVVFDQEKDADASVVEKITAILKERHEAGRAVGLDEVKQLGRDEPVADDGFGAKPKRGDLYCIMVRIWARQGSGLY